MIDVRRLIGGALLIAVVVAAGSVMCLAAGQSMAPDCNNGMQGAATCPFMTVSTPTIPNSFTGREVVVLFIISLVFVPLLGVARYNEKAEMVARSRLWLTSKRPPESFLNTVIQFISSGILHSRVFGF